MYNAIDKCINYLPKSGQGALKCGHAPLPTKCSPDTARARPDMAVHRPDTGPIGAGTRPQSRAETSLRLGVRPRSGEVVRSREGLVAQRTDMREIGSDTVPHRPDKGPTGPDNAKNYAATARPVPTQAPLSRIQARQMKTFTCITAAREFAVPEKPDRGTVRDRVSSKGETFP